MTFDDALKRKEMTMIAPRVRFNFVYDVLDEKFEGGHVSISLLSADRTERDSKDVPISKFNFTTKQKSTLATMFQAKIGKMLAGANLTIDDEIFEGPRGPLS